jgi:hypothetical protein
MSYGLKTYSVFFLIGADFKYFYFCVVYFLFYILQKGFFIVGPPSPNQLLQIAFMKPLKNLYTLS